VLLLHLIRVFQLYPNYFFTKHYLSTLIISLAKTPYVVKSKTGINRTYNFSLKKLRQIYATKIKKMLSKVKKYSLKVLKATILPQIGNSTSSIYNNFEAIKQEITIKTNHWLTVLK